MNNNEVIMKRFLFTSILLIGLVSSFYAQDTIISTKKSTEKLEKPNAIFFAPINLFDFVNPNFQMGYERFVAKKWAIQIEVGIIINHSIENCLIDWLSGSKVKDCPYTNKGFRVKTSVKYIVFGRKVIKLYVSPELFYMKNRSGIVRDFSVSDFNFNYPTPIPDGTTAYKNFFYNDEQKMGINFKFGIKLLLGKRFLLEPHVGLGLAYRIVTQTGRYNLNDKIIYDFGIFDNAATNKLTLTFPVNLKIGCRF
jgi:hypothetical protein